MDINMIKKDLEELEAAQERLECEKNSTIINFFNEEYGAGYSEDRYFECFENLFSEDEDGAGYLDPYDLRLGWDEVQLFLYWQTMHDYNQRQGLTAEVLEMLASSDERRRNHGKNGIKIALSGIEKSMDELQKIVDSAKSAMDRLEVLKQVLHKYK